MHQMQKEAILCALHDHMVWLCILHIGIAISFEAYIPDEYLYLLDHMCSFAVITNILLLLVLI